MKKVSTRQLQWCRRFHAKKLLDSTENSPPATYQSESFEQNYHVRYNLEKIIHFHANKPYVPVNLNMLMKYGSGRGFKELLSDPRKDRSFLDELKADQIIEAANETLNRILVLNAKRLIHLRSLPYMVVLNPHISLSYSLYLQSMREILSVPKITSIEMAHDFVNILKDFLDKHADAIPRLSKGFTEIIGKFYPKDLAFKFLDQHLRERIVMKLTAQHFIFLLNPPARSSLGVVDLDLNISEIVQNSADFVNELCNLKYMKNCDIEIETNSYTLSPDGKHVEQNLPIRFPYISENLEYCVTELLKNSFRAHIENGVSQSIQILINKYKSENSEVPMLEMRFRDSGGGIEPSIQQQMYDFSFTTVKDENDIETAQDNRSVAGMGYGLGLSKTYCQIFGGSLHVESYFGHGTDVYLKIKGPDMSLLQR